MNKEDFEKYKRKALKKALDVTFFNKWPSDLKDKGKWILRKDRHDFYYANLLIVTVPVIVPYTKELN